MPKISFFLAMVLLLALFMTNFVNARNTDAQLSHSEPSSETSSGLNPITTEENKNLNTLNISAFKWKSFAHAKVFQSDDELDIIVDTQHKGPLYNRAYLQTQLNTTSPPFALSLEYSYRTGIGNTSYAVEIRDRLDNTILASYRLGNGSTTEIFPLRQDISGKPIEFRFYVITNEPTFCLLSIKEANVIL